MNTLVPTWIIKLVRFIRRFVLPVTPAFVVRILAFGLFAKSRPLLKDSTENPEETQREKLLDMVQVNAKTVFGQEHDFASIKTVDDYRKAVPIRSYDELEPYLKRIADGEWRILTMEAPTFFGQTSGTTGAAKLIPVTARYRDEFTRPRRIWYYRLVQTLPKILRGANLAVRSVGASGQSDGGIPYGAISAALDNRPQEQVDGPEGISLFPDAIYTIADIEARYYVLLRHALSLPIALITAVNPSSIAILCDRLDQHADALAEDCEKGTLNDTLTASIDPKLRTRLLRSYRPDASMAKRLRASREKHGYVRPIDLWPRLCGLICWKAGPASFYLDRFPQWFGNLPVMGAGYVATEGYFAIPMDTKSNDSVLAVMGPFFEFVEVEAWDRGDRETLLAHQLEEGKFYRIIITTSAGLYRYDINDVIEVTGFYNKTPRVRFSHKGGTVSSITGEKLTEAQVTTAVYAAAKAVNLELTGFTLGLRLGDPPSYVLAAELSQESTEETLSNFLQRCEEELGKANVEYPAKRDSKRLGPLQLIQLAKGSFAQERARRLASGSHDPQLKIPYLQPDEALIGRMTTVKEIGSGVGDVDHDLAGV